MHGVDGIGQREDREDGADDRNQRRENDPHHIGRMFLEQRGHWQLGLRVGLFLLLEGRGLGQAAPHPHADGNDQGTEEERDPPASGQQLLLRQLRDGQEHERRQYKASLRAAEREAGVERALIGRCVLQGHGVGASLLTGRGDALQQPRDHQQNGRHDPYLTVGGQQPYHESRNSHQQQGEDQDLLAAKPVSDMAEHDRAERPGNVGDAECRERRGLGLLDEKKTRGNISAAAVP
jgi:hypothetical protein